ncbi:MAG: hypothetical protein C0595_10510 [Marinilabiliales bacterium]|nr:MAG: hypothetical protein C0595_10510 [Marinilabiliales bacterium]
MKIWEFIYSKLKKDIEVVLMIVISSKGTSPGHNGFKMAVADDGKLQGSLGGGLTEYEMVELAKKQFKKRNYVFKKTQIDNSPNLKNPDEILNTGSQQIAFYLFDKTYMPLIESISKATTGKLVFSHQGILFNRELVATKQYESKIIDDKQWTFTERIGFSHYLYIFGGGHISVELSLIFKRLGFHITVLDDRDKTLNSFKQNNYANSRKIISYKKASKYVPGGDNVYVVIMTFEHKNDHKVLKQMLNKNIKYLGMMGSKSTVDSVYKKLIKKGYDKGDFEKVDAPIGISINSKTATEIAISIAAKIIHVKNSEKI